MRKLFACIAALMIGACTSTTGTSIGEERLAELKQRKATIQEVVAQFGQPNASQLMPNGERLLVYLKQQGQSGRNLPVLAADGAIAQMGVKAEHRHPFHLSQMLAEASAFVPSDRHVAAIGMRDAFLNELLANNRLDPFLLRLDADMRLHAGNMLGRLLSEMVPDADLQAVHDGTVPVTAFTGLQDAIRNLESAQCVVPTSLGALWPRPASALLEIEQ